MNTKLKMALEKTPLFAEERQQKILAILAENGRVINAELVELLGFAEPTIRRDIVDLANSGKLIRTHGGAIALRAQIEPELPVRISRNAQAKTAIAKACVGMIQAGDGIFLDAGSTSLRIAEILRDQLIATSEPRNVNVLTNAVPVAQTLSEIAGIRHTGLGGTYRPTGACFVGPLTVENLTLFKVNIAFIGVTGFTSGVFTAADLTEAQVKIAAIRGAQKVVVPMDASKVGATDFAKVCEITEVTTIVTEKSNDYLKKITKDSGVELLIARSKN